MPRSSIIGTAWQNAWGTAGTQSLVPAPHVEGLGSWAEKMDDRMCFLAFQQSDVAFCRDINQNYSFPHNTFGRLEQWRIYYNGYHPQVVMGFDVYRSGQPLAISATFSVRLGDVDFGTGIVTLSNATKVEWYTDIPTSFAAGEYAFKLYGASGDDNYWALELAGPWMTFLPTRL